MPAPAASTPESSSATATTPNPKFILFGQLPAELRLQIWNFALPDSRILRMNSRYVSSGYKTCPKIQFSIANPLSGLGMLQTCSEAREVVLGSFNEIPDCGFKIAYPVYLSTEDILYFGRLNELEDFASRGCGDCVRESGVRRVAVWLNYMQGPGAVYDANRLWQCVTMFSKLEECVLVVPRTAWDPECDLIRALVKYEERDHQLKVAEEGPVAPPRSFFTGVVESDFRRGQSTDKYH